MFRCDTAAVLQSSGATTSPAKLHRYSIGYPVLFLAGRARYKGKGTGGKTSKLAAGLLGWHIAPLKILNLF